MATLLGMRAKRGAYLRYRDRLSSVYESCTVGIYGKADSRVSPTGEVDDEDRREMSVSAVVSPTGALTMVGFLAVVDCRSPD